MRYLNRAIVAVLLAVTGFVVALTAIGCRHSEQATVVPVSGRVLFNGAPLKFGSVTFQPAQGQPAQGTIDSNGEFKLSTYRPGDGATPGRHHVKIACYSSQDPAEKANKSVPSESLGESLIPIRYTSFETSGLEVAVLAGGNKPFVFELKSEAPAQVNGTPETKTAEAANPAQPPGSDDGRETDAKPADVVPENSEKK